MSLDKMRNCLDRLTSQIEGMEKEKVELRIFIDYDSMSEEELDKIIEIRLSEGCREFRKICKSLTDKEISHFEQYNQLPERVPVRYRNLLKK